MYNIPQFKQRLVIIDDIDLDDATILIENYESLIQVSDDSEEKSQYIVLRSLVQTRIKELSNIES